MQSWLSTYTILCPDVKMGDKNPTPTWWDDLRCTEVHSTGCLLCVVTWGRCLPPLIPRLSFCMAWWNLIPSHLSCLGCESSLHPVYPVCVCHPPTGYLVTISFNKPTVSVSQYLHAQVTPLPQKIYLKFDELFLLGNLQILIFWDFSWLSLAKLVESELADKKKQVYFI